MTKQERIEHAAIAAMQALIPAGRPDPTEVAAEAVRFALALVDEVDRHTTAALPDRSRTDGNTLGNATGR